MPNSLRYAVFTSAAAIAAAVLAACVSAPEPGERGFEPYMAGMTDHELAWRQLEDEERHLITDELLQEPLDIDTAAKVALLNHPGVQADIRHIELTEGELRQEAALANPEFDTEALLWGDGDVQTIETTLLVDLAAGLQQRSRVRAAAQGIEASRAEAAEDLIDFIFEVQHRWIDAVAARERLQRVRDIVDGHRAMAEAAELHHDAGTIADDELHLIEVEALEAELAIQRAEDRAQRARHRLEDALGLDDEQWSIPDELPDVPGRVNIPDDAEERAVTRSARLEQLDRHSKRTAAQIRAERWGGAFPEVALGGITDWDIDTGQFRFGPAFRLQLPIFDRRSPTRDVLRAEQVILDFESRKLARQIKYDLRSAEHRLRTTHNAAHHYRDEVLPLRERTVDDALEQYNAMTISALELLDVKRRHLESQRDFVDIRSDFWRAAVEMDRLLSGGLPP